MALFGWIAMVLVMLYLTAAWLPACTQTLGRYNAGHWWRSGGWSPARRHSHWW